MKEGKTETREKVQKRHRKTERDGPKDKKRYRKYRRTRSRSTERVDMISELKRRKERFGPISTKVIIKTKSISCTRSLQ